MAWVDDIDFESLDADQLAKLIVAEYWRRVFDAQDDLLFNGTNNAKDESLDIFGLTRTYD